MIKNSQLTESNIQNIRLNKTSSESELLNRPKIPLFVSLDSFKETIREIVYRLQIKNIKKEDGIDLLLGRGTLEGSEQKTINLHQIICILDNPPFCIENY